MSRSRNTQRYRDAKAFRYVSGVRPPILSRVLLYGNGCPDCGSGRCDWCESNDRRRNIRRAYEPVRDLLADALDPSCSCEGCSGASECPGCGELWCDWKTSWRGPFFPFLAQAKLRDARCGRHDDLHSWRHAAAMARLDEIGLMGEIAAARAERLLAGDFGSYSSNSASTRNDARNREGTGR